MKSLALLLTSVVLIAPAFAQADTALTAQDFITQVAKSDMFEVQSSQIASDRADGDVKSFAQKMIADHGKTTEELTGMVARNAVKAELPTAMDPAQQALLDKLKSLQGDEFTKEYIAEQVAAHQKAVALFKQYAVIGDHAGVKYWAINTEPALEEHLMMAEKLAK